MAKKLPGWFARLSAPVRAAVEAHVSRSGYSSATGSPGEVVAVEHDFDGWLADMMTTAHRSPKGYILRFQKILPAPAPLNPEDLQLPLGGGLGG